MELSEVAPRRDCRIRVLKDIKDCRGNLIFRKDDALPAVFSPLGRVYWATAVDGYRCWLEVNEVKEIKG